MGRREGSEGRGFLCSYGSAVYDSRAWLVSVVSMCEQGKGDTLSGKGEDANGMVENTMSIINKNVKQKLLIGLNYRCSTQPIL